MVKNKPECSNACPAGINVKAYISLIANRKFEEAVEVIREANPFPAICGRVCNRPCEEHCEIGLDGDSVQIRALKRFACDYELARRPLYTKPCENIYKEKIAVIGAGPAGLSAALDLIRMGYYVNVFEAKDEPGGMLRYAIPSYRLPKRILKREIDWIKSLGVEIITKKRIGKPEKLLKEGFSAVLIAQGSPKSLNLNIKGEEAEGVIDPLLFLHNVNTKKKIKLNGEVVVIGGGSTAFDVARSAVRLGAKKVTIAYRRSIKEMPAELEEIEDAKREGVNIKTLLTPEEIITENGMVKGINFFKAKLGEPDESGRRKPIPIKNNIIFIKADLIFPAVGAKPDIKYFKHLKITNEKERIEVEDGNKTKYKGIFAAGDVQTGPSYVVEAIKQGHIAANGIHSYLRGTKEFKIDNNFDNIPVIEEFNEFSKYIHIPKRLTENKRLNSFHEVEKSFIDFEAVDEASRCFRCGPCNLCSVCLPNCDNKQLIANIDNSRFLLKVPRSLSSFIYDNDNTNYDIKYNGDIKHIKLRSLIARVDSNLCIGCGRCEEVCSYRAITYNFKKNKPIVAEVDHNSCASCSACVSVCPTGAISQGYMSDDEILSRLNKKKPVYKYVKAFMSFWSTSSNFLEIFDGMVELMSIRKLSPSFIIRGLARTDRGLLLIGPDERTGSHYLPWENSPKDVVEKAKKLLKSVGISTDRIKYLEIRHKTNPDSLLEKFSKNLDNKKIKRFDILIPNIKMNPLSESITLLRIFSANPDKKPEDDLIRIPPAKKNGVALFEGCLPLLNLIGHSHKLFDLSHYRISIHGLLKKLDFDYGQIPDLLCPSRGLLDLDIDESCKIVDLIAENNISNYNKIKPCKLILCTPESYITFSKLNAYKNITSLPNELYKALKKSNEFKPVNKTIAIHRACNLNKDPFFDDTKKLLSLIPGVSIIDLKVECGFDGFDNLNADSKIKSLKLMNAALEKNADIIICTSPYCTSHLLLSNREGSWRTKDIEINNLYSILLSSLKEDDN